MLVQIVSIVFPVFTVIAVGYLYGRKHRPDMLATNQVNMGIFVPALIFSALAGKSVDLAEVQMIALGGLVIVLGSGLLGWPIARWLVSAMTLLKAPGAVAGAGALLQGSGGEAERLGIEALRAGRRLALSRVRPSPPGRSPPAAG